MTEEEPRYHRDPPDGEGFVAWTFRPPRFNSSFGTIRARAEPDGAVLIRIETGMRAANFYDRLHGGFALAALDQAMPIAIATLRDQPFGGVVTLALSTSFIGAGAIDRPFDVIASIVGETGRLYFLSGSIVQGDDMILGWQATMRKVRR
jgi:acyl-coenzyme A thioesterase PaaI-like protein